MKRTEDRISNNPLTIEGLDIRIRGVSWPDSKTGSMEGIMDNAMPDKLSNFEPTVRKLGCFSGTCFLWFLTFLAILGLLKGDL